MVRDFLRAAEKAWGDAWGHASYMITRPVTLKAMLRVCADLAGGDAEPETIASSGGRASSRRGATSRSSFRQEGFYERFPAKGQVERVARIHKELARAANIERRRQGRRHGRLEATSDVRAETARHADQSRRRVDRGSQAIVAICGPRLAAARASRCG